MKPKHYLLRFVNKLYSQLVKEDFEFLSIIDMDDLSMTVLSKKDKSIVPYLLLDKKTMTYNSQFDNFINYSVEIDDREQARKDMNIERVREELSNRNSYSVNHSVKLPGRS